MALKLIKKIALFGSKMLGDIPEREYLKIKNRRIKESAPQRVEEYIKNHQVRKLQIGSGPYALEGWLNTDIRFDHKIVYMDASIPFTVPADSFDYIFNEHFLEHINYMEGRLFVKECFKSLRSGGKIRIATPNLEFLLSVYGEGKGEQIERYKEFTIRKWFKIKESYSHTISNQDAFVINNFFYNWGHRFIYDFKTLKDLLENQGFQDIKRCKVQESDDPNFLDLEMHWEVITKEFNELETMVIEATKP